MKIQTAIKKVENKFGKKVQIGGTGEHYLECDGNILSFIPNGGMKNYPNTDATNFGTRTNGQITFHDNLTQAINFFKKRL